MKWGADMGIIPFRLCLGKQQELFPGRKLSCRDDFGIDLGMLPGVRVRLLHSQIKIFSILVSCLLSGGCMQLRCMFSDVFHGKIWLVLGI